MISKMKQFGLFILALSLFTSCIDLGFERQQPISGKKLMALPADYAGTYVNKEDTLIILSDMVISGTDTTLLALDSYMELREWKDFIFLNSHKLGGNYWTAIVVTKKEDKLVIYTPNLGEEDNVKLAKKFTVREYYNEQGNLEALIIDPSEKDWKKLLNGPFYEKSAFTKIQ